MARVRKESSDRLGMWSSLFVGSAGRNNRTLRATRGPPLRRPRAVVMADRAKRGGERHPDGRLRRIERRGPAQIRDGLIMTSLPRGEEPAVGEDHGLGRVQGSRAIEEGGGLRLPPGGDERASEI